MHIVIIVKELKNVVFMESKIASLFCFERPL